MTAAQPRVLFVTASTPMTDREEAFVQDELTEMRCAGADLLVVPMRKRRSTANGSSVRSGLDLVTIGEPLVGLRVLAGSLFVLVSRPVAVCRIVTDIARRSGGRRNLVVNLMSLPKSLWLSRVVSQRGATHLHAYWLSHTATAAWIASTLSGVPWSGSGFRWDINAGNLFGRKLPTATFIRCADEFGRAELTAALEAHAATPPVVLVRTGVAMQEPAWDARPVRPHIVVCAGAFVEKKAHVIAVRAFSRLHAKRPDARLHIFGEGPLAETIEREIAAHGLTEHVELHGTVPLAELREFLATRPTTVLPSIVTADLQQEGIPVTLIEAMASGSPVVSTPTGSIADLIRPGCGILVAPGAADALAEAIIGLADRPALANDNAQRAFQRVREEFDITRTARTMLGLCAAGAVAT